MTAKSKNWRCFHCDEVFTDRIAAAEHFGDGDYEDETPLCIEAATKPLQTLILTNREMWDSLQNANGEIEELTDHLGGLESVISAAIGKADPTTEDLRLALQRAEEAGYAKGLQDAKTTEVR